MAEVELILPKMGESIIEATIISWNKNEGDSIQEDETVLEIATDKVDSEIPSPYSGVLKKILYQPDDVVQIGSPIAIIEIAGESSVPTQQKPQKEPPAQKPAETKQESPQKEERDKKTKVFIPRKKEEPTNDEGRFYSPLVRNIARAEGISFDELETIEGTGGKGRVTKYDLLNYIDTRSTSPAPQSKIETPSQSIKAQVNQSTTNQASTSPSPQIANTTGNVEIEQMDRMRQAIANHMVHSKKTSAHVTSFVEADVTNMVLWRNRTKENFLKTHGEKLTFTPLFVEAVVAALNDFPKINSSLDGQNIVIKKDYNLGIATALPDGNLIVPVIKKAQQLSLIGLANQVNDLSNKARNKQLKPDDIQGGTFTISNIGTFGNIMGTPIINQPQVAILAIGAINKKPVVVESAKGDTIGIRHMMFLSLSYDHRIIDGFLGGSFLKRIAENIEAFDVNRKI